MSCGHRPDKSGCLSQWRLSNDEVDKDDDEDEESSVISNDSPSKENMGINIVFTLPIGFHAMDKAGIAQLSVGIKDA